MVSVSIAQQTRERLRTFPREAPDDHERHLGMRITMLVYCVAEHPIATAAAFGLTMLLVTAAYVGAVS